MQSLLRSKLIPSLLGVTAVKLMNDFSENKVWGAAPLNCAQHDIKIADLSKGQGAIIDKYGSLIQFKLPLVSMGPPFTKLEEESVQEYTTIIRGNLTDVACTLDKVFSLSANGTIFKTIKGQNNTINSSIYNWFYPEHTVKCDGLSWGEKIVQIDGGDHFVIARSNKGRLFGMLADNVKNDTSLYCIGGNTKEGTLSLIQGLERVNVTDVKCGNEHVLALSDHGHVFGWGNNQYGQLGFSELEPIKVPSEISTLWNPINPSLKPNGVNCTAIATGDDFSLFVIDSAESTEVLATGFGQYGQLGQPSKQFVSHPVKVKEVSNLSEFDENLGKTIPIRVAGLFAGSAHAGVILDNIIDDSAEDVSSGRDIYLWGQNAYGELNIDKKTKASPVAPDISGSHEHSKWGLKNEKLRLKKNWTMALGHGVTLVYPKVNKY